LASRKINKLRVFNNPGYSDSPASTIPDGGNGVPSLSRGTFRCSAHVLLLHAGAFRQLVLHGG
jgi:hypothetical protein